MFPSYGKIQRSPDRYGSWQPVKTYKMNPKIKVPNRKYEILPTELRPAEGFRINRKNSRSEIFRRVPGNPAAWRFDSRAPGRFKGYVKKI
jgi:hypothetical protein